MEGEGILETPEVSPHVAIDHHATSGIPAPAGRKGYRQLGAELVAALRRVPRRIEVEHQPEPGPHIGSEPAPCLVAGEPQLHADLEQAEIRLDRTGPARGG